VDGAEAGTAVRADEGATARRPEKGVYGDGRSPGVAVRGDSPDAKGTRRRLRSGVAITVTTGARKSSDSLRFVWLDQLVRPAERQQESRVRG
jgi:hypothetical protein